MCKTSVANKTSIHTEGHAPEIVGKVTTNCQITRSNSGFNGLCKTQPMFVLVLWHINLFRLLNAKFVFIHIVQF